MQRIGDSISVCDSVTCKKLYGYGYFCQFGLQEVEIMDLKKMVFVQIMFLCRDMSSASSLKDTMAIDMPPSSNAEAYFGDEFYSVHRLD